VRNLLINRLRTKFECSNMSHHAATTKTKLLGGRQILQDISYLENVGAVIAESRSILNNDQSTKTKQTSALRNLDLVQNALTVLQENVAQGVMKSVYISGFFQASARVGNAEKRNLSNEWSTPSNKRRKSFDEFAVESMIKNHQADSVTKTPLKASLNRKRAAKSAPRYPQPVNRSMYRPDEAVLTMRGISARKERGRLLKEWITHGKIGCKGRQMREYLLRAKEPGYVLPTRWAQWGQPVLATSKELKVIFETKTINTYRTMGVQELREELVQLKKTRLQARGFAADAATVRVSLQTAQSYKCQAALEVWTTTTGKTLSKTDRRFQAMNSLMSAVSILATILRTHFS
jgi:hypothetical protein